MTTTLPALSCSVCGPRPRPARPAFRELPSGPQAREQAEEPPGRPAARRCTGWRRRLLRLLVGCDLRIGGPRRAPAALRRDPSAPCWPPRALSAPRPGPSVLDPRPGPPLAAARSALSESSRTRRRRALHASLARMCSWRGLLTVVAARDDGRFIDGLSPRLEREGEGADLTRPWLGSAACRKRGPCRRGAGRADFGEARRPVAQSGLPRVSRLARPICSARVAVTKRTRAPTSSSWSARWRACGSPTR